jgi:hypothetical protein
MPNPRIQEGSQKRPDGHTWLDDPVDRSTFRMSFDNASVGLGNVLLLLTLSGQESRTHGVAMKTCGLILEEIECSTESLYRRAGMFEFIVDEALRSSVPQDVSATTMRDYSCLRCLQHSQKRIVTLV